MSAAGVLAGMLLSKQITRDEAQRIWECLLLDQVAGHPVTIADAIQEVIAHPDWHAAHEIRTIRKRWGKHEEQYEYVVHVTRDCRCWQADGTLLPYGQRQHHV